MGCGLISQRGSTEVRSSGGSGGAGGASGASNVGAPPVSLGTQAASQADHQIPVADPGVRSHRHRFADSNGALEPAIARRSPSGGAAAHGALGSHGAMDSQGYDYRPPDERPPQRPHLARGSDEAPPPGRPMGRRFIMGERIVLTSRLPNNLQDHAFCFECGAFFQLTTARTAVCSRCGSGFVQYLRGQGHDRWLSTGSHQYSFDDQLEVSLNASLQETPPTKRPTQVAFIKGLPELELTEADMEVRSKLEAADPLCHCAICREGFALGDLLKRLPCQHEFHGACVATWLKVNNTCPICRCQLPEAGMLEGEEDEVEQALEIKQHENQGSSGGPAAGARPGDSGEGAAVPLERAGQNSI